MSDNLTTLLLYIACFITSGILVVMVWWFCYGEKRHFFRIKIAPLLDQFCPLDDPSKAPPFKARDEKEDALSVKIGELVVDINYDTNDWRLESIAIRHCLRLNIERLKKTCETPELLTLTWKVMEKFLNLPTSEYPRVKEWKLAGINPDMIVCIAISVWKKSVAKRLNQLCWCKPGGYMTAYSELQQEIQTVQALGVINLGDKRLRRIFTRLDKERLQFLREELKLSKHNPNLYLPIAKEFLSIFYTLKITGDEYYDEVLFALTAHVTEEKGLLPLRNIF